jgi:non-specific serine/threonine protein kinase
MIGRSLSHYKILRELGHGGMGVVYKAEDTNLRRLVALKLLPPEVAADPERISLLKREARAIAALDHPRIVTIYSIEQEEEELFLTMELIEGTKLQDAIPRNGFELQEFLQIAIPLADALSTAHARGIIHRDLKPGNIMLSTDGLPKILDFGLAKLRDGGAQLVETRASTESVTVEGRMAGTIPYMSPEQLCRDIVDYRSDIFSFGIILYEMATGQHPFAKDSGNVASSILRDSPVSVSEVRVELPRQLGRIIRHCLEKDKEQRTQSAKDLRNELEDLQREVSASRTVTPPPPVKRRSRVVLLALVVVAVITFAGAFFYQRHATSPPSARPYNLTVIESRSFSGDRGPDYFRQGVVEVLRRRLGGLRGVYRVGQDDGPVPDIFVDTDVRKIGETLTLRFRLRDSRSGITTAGEVLEGDTDDLVRLVDLTGRSIAKALRSEFGLATRYRPARQPVARSDAYDPFLRALAALNRSQQQGDYAAAHALVRQALTQSPQFTWALALDGQVFLEEYRGTLDRQLLQSAEASCRAAVEFAADFAAAHTCLGDSLYLQQRALDAVTAYREAIRQDATELPAHYGLRAAYLSLGLPQEAEEAWTEVIEAHPGFWGGYYSLGTYYQDAEDYESALKHYRHALELAPENPSLYAYLGTVYYYLGRYEEAAISLQKSIEIQPNWDAYYNLGGLHFSLRRFDESVAAFKRAVELRENDYRSYGRLGWACYWAPGLRAEAELYLEQAVELGMEVLQNRPEDANVLILTALFQAMIGRTAASLESLDKALEIRPSDPHTFFLAGLVQNHLGNSAVALDWLERAVAGGYSTAEIRMTVDLDNLHGEERFQTLLRGG